MGERARRNTRQLEVIWEAIKDDNSHPTADQIYARVRGRLPNVSLGTVYRNLQKLVIAGKLQVLTLGRSRHFDPLVRHHQHFICERCGCVYDIVVDSEQELTLVSLPEQGFTVTSHQLSFYGTCKRCSAQPVTV